jgi:hypothetical protein
MGDIGSPVLSVAGVVVIPGWGCMHPYTYRDICGEEAYQELITGPRVVTEYDVEDGTEKG